MPRYNVKAEFELTAADREEAQKRAADAVRWYPCTGHMAASFVCDGIGCPDGWVTVEEVGA